MLGDPLALLPPAPSQARAAASANAPPTLTSKSSAAMLTQESLGHATARGIVHADEEHARARRSW